MVEDGTSSAHGYDQWLKTVPHLLMDVIKG